MSEGNKNIVQKMISQLVNWLVPEKETQEKR